MLPPKDIAALAAFNRAQAEGEIEGSYKERKAFLIGFDTVYEYQRDRAALQAAGAEARMAAFVLLVFGSVMAAAVLYMNYLTNVRTSLTLPLISAALFSVAIPLHVLSGRQHRKAVGAFWKKWS